MRVLVATDRPTLGAALTLYLTEHGVDVAGVVAHAEDICSSVAATPADVVLVDWHLGDTAAARAVADLKHSPGHMPVIVMGSSQDSASAQVSGADGFATLGDPPDALLALMHEVAPALT